MIGPLLFLSVLSRCMNMLPFSFEFFFFGGCSVDFWPVSSWFLKIEELKGRLSMLSVKHVFLYSRVPGASS